MKKVNRKTFLNDAIDLIGMCAHSLNNDDFSNCFVSNTSYEATSSTPFYIFSIITRYFILLPIRIILIVICCILTSALFLYGNIYSNYVIISDSFYLFNKIMMFVMWIKISHYGAKKKIKEPHVYVSNHTSFIDYMILSSHKFSHACIAESHGGLFGFILNKILSKNGSIGFKRSDKQDRSLVLSRIKNHVLKNMPPMLIFPEGTCVNNRYVLLFQKGIFELDFLICPVAIKYSTKLLEPYWNRRLHGFSMHILYLLTRWRLDVDVHWMDPMKKEIGESSIDFSHKVKLAISKQANLKNSLWNGSFKSSPVLNDREILKSCFTTVYNKIKNNKIKEDLEKEKKLERFWFYEENIDQTSINDKIYFGNTKYKTFINLCCKEYLKIKNKEE